jgi:hypothetical protein
MDAPDTRKSSAITDHPFRPRTINVWAKAANPDGYVFLPPNDALCQHCRLAEAAHSETTVKR